MGKISVTSDVVSRGKNSGLFSMEDKFTDSERKAMLTMMEDVYEQFTSKASAGRKLDAKKMEALAQGRLWSGRQAQKNGLVDEVGTLRDALTAAETQAGVKEDEKVEVMVLPKPKSIFEQLFDPGATDARLGKQAKTTLDSVLPKAGEQAADVVLWRQLLNEKAVLMLPYRVEVK